MTSTQSPLAITPYLLPGFDEPYTTVEGTPHYGPVHGALAGESLTDHHIMQSRMRRDGPTGAYVGFGGWINLGYIAALQPEFSVLADINALQALYWQRHLAAVESCATKKEFERQMPELVEAIQNHADALPDGFSGHLTNPEHTNTMYGAFRDNLKFWVEEGCDGYALSDAAYGSLRELVLDKRVVVAVVDAKDEAKMLSLRAEVERRKQPASRTVVHLSNLLDFIKGEEPDWAGTDCSKYALLDAKRHARLLAHGLEKTERGHIIYTRSSVKYGVQATKTGEIDLFDWGSARHVMANNARSAKIPGPANLG